MTGRRWRFNDLGVVRPSGLALVLGRITYGFPRWPMRRKVSRSSRIKIDQGSSRAGVNAHGHSLGKSNAKDFLHFRAGLVDEVATGFTAYLCVGIAAL